ncbi:hypothetical protein IWQ60_006266 [Tieghemiomyces parasiticus]|uniref:Translation initiation factor eIF2B subunit delta n=1 Tax=Tieghemiomyces parasiticus TaxID=78921 RepID=A0A9W8A4R4_9FUNG|nr:hypothetical protein IWQ60_006266 [Tieghemiomyces parasiticus]
MNSSAASSPNPSAEGTPTKGKAKAPKKEGNQGNPKAADKSTKKNAAKAGATAPNKGLAKTGAKTAPTESKISPLFTHLEERAYPPSTAHAATGVHPVVRSLGLQFAEFKICGSNARCIAMLQAFKQVIEDYQTPTANTLCRHLPTYLSTQITYLVSMRPMAVTMGNAIRFLKYHISVLDIDLPESNSKQLLVEKIDEFIRDRITVADRLIVSYGVPKIQDGDVILTFACSSVVRKILLAAHARGTRFRVVVVDSRPLLEGRRLLDDLVAAGLPCTYTYLNALSYVLKDVSKVFLGTHAVLSNGTLFSRAGTSLVAMSAHGRNIPVIVCTEIYKFTERVQLDAVVMNELGHPHDIVVAGPKGSTPPNPRADLTKWKTVPKLNILNLMYDVTPAEHLTMAITEVGMIPFTSVPVVLREYRL